MTTTQQYHTDAIVDAYYKLLESHVYKERFYTDMMNFISARPYFFAPYIELVDYLESLTFEDERREFLNFTVRRISEFLSNKKALDWAQKNLTQKEIAYMTRALDRYIKANGFSGRIMFLKASAQRLYSKTSKVIEKEPQNLKHLCHVSNMHELQKELLNNEQWWMNYTARQNAFIVQRHTNAIVLRAIPGQGEEKYIPIDGLHESRRTPLTTLFPQTISVIEEFAKVRGGGLGRVALVRLKPHSMVYRHWDAEDWLRGRSRYHVVVKSPDGSHMTSGIESSVFQEGDLFFFENKKMHTAENASDNWRTHIIFDMFEGDKKAENNPQL